MSHFIKYTSFLFLLLSACSYSRFTITGAPYEALPENADIQVVGKGDLSKFEQIGIAEIKDSDKEYRIKEAKRLARLYGGDVIMPVKENGDTSKIQRFLVLVPIYEEVTEPVETVLEEELPEEPILEELPEPEPKPEVKKKPDYSKLPVVPYKILVGEFASLKGERFKAFMYPKKVTGFPGELKRYAKKNTQLIRAGTQKGGDIVYLVSEKEKTKKLLRYIKTKKRLGFVYTPIALYNQTYPVVKLIDIIE